MMLLYETESDFNVLSVYEDNKGVRYLRVGKGWELHSGYDPKHWVLQEPEQNYWNYFLLIPHLKKVKRVLLLGLAAGTMARQYAHFYPSVEIDGVEIDGEIVKIGREYFALRNKNLKVFVEDAEEYVEKCRKKYDAIVLDTFTGGNLDKKFLNVEFFGKLKGLLREGGMVVANYCSDMGVPYLIKRATTKHFKHMSRVPNPGTYNYILFASDKKISFDGVVLEVDEELKELAQYCKKKVILDK